jgi:tetratricopeptide (TPR) repeat protein
MIVWLLVAVALIFALPCDAQGLRGVGPEHMPFTDWQDQLAKEERQLKLKLVEVDGSKLGVLDPRCIPTLESLERVLDEQGKDDERAQILRRLLKAQQTVHGPETEELGDVISTLRMLASCVGEKNPAEAQKFLLEAMKIAKTDKTTPAWVFSTLKQELSVLALNLGRLDEAERLSLEAIAMSKRNHEWSDTYHLLDVYRRCKRWNNALRLNDEELRKAQKKGDTEMVFAALVDIAETHCERKDDSALLRAYRNFEKCRRSHPQAAPQALLSRMANALAKRKMYEQAWIMRSAELSRKTAHHYFDWDSLRGEEKATRRLANLVRQRPDSQAEYTYFKRWADAVATLMQKLPKIGAR